MLKGSLEKSNYPHWPIYFSHGCPRMPIASKKVGMLAIEQCKLIWPDLTFNTPVDYVVKWPARSLYMMRLTHENNDAIAYGGMQSCLTKSNTHLLRASTGSHSFYRSVSYVPPHYN